jgi:ribosome-interacting GTPase 1
MKLYDAIYRLNPSVVTIRDNVAYDANEQVVEYDLAAAEALVAANEYKTKRASEYPDFKDYLDGIVKGDQAQIQAYIDACNAVKNKYPKGQV